ncbi:hypothetical protein CP98_05242 [Sphingobium yanoikuyae]|uniref:Uncharacterized protein n=1 Tax=Sphingobium yanoikuyae TaxID=13690 RepID=A0A084E244_SPHYA|nr:hypothetical protein CP98_05242 [Sphingobium yanoikuyae]
MEKAACGRPFLLRAVWGTGGCIMQAPARGMVGRWIPAVAGMTKKRRGGDADGRLRLGRAGGGLARSGALAEHRGGRAAGAGLAFPGAAGATGAGGRLAHLADDGGARFRQDAGRGGMGARHCRGRSRGADRAGRCDFGRGAQRDGGGGERPAGGGALVGKAGLCPGAAHADLAQWRAGATVRGGRARKPARAAVQPWLGRRDRQMAGRAGGLGQYDDGDAAGA